MRGSKTVDTRTFLDFGSVCFASVLLMLFQAQAQSEMSADISISRHVQSQGLLPAVGDYVRYEISVTNSGQSAIAGQSLWVRLESEGGRTNSTASFSISSLEPGSKTVIHAGPFKTLEAGEHHLFVGINEDDDPSQEDDVLTNLAAGRPADSFGVYSQALATTIPVGIGIASAGAIILTVVFSRRKR